MADDHHNSTAVLTPYRLTKELRREVCIHEAAHAVIGALWGYNHCYCLAVAPEGSEDWSYTNRKGRTTTGLLGNHEGSDAPFPWFFMEWDEDESHFNGTKAKAAQRDLLATLSRQGKSWHYRSLRAHLCFCLAGYIAENLLRDEEDPNLEPESYAPGDDITQAEVTAWLLPFRREFDHAVSITTGALRDHWPLVLSLADALEAKGTLEDEELEPYLPQRLKDWPPSPRRAVREG